MNEHNVRTYRSESDEVSSVLDDWKIFIKNRSKVDMNSCVPGQKLVTRLGNIVTYCKKFKNPYSYYPHKIEYKNGSIGSRTDEGWVFINMVRPTDEDIVYILKSDS